MLMVHLIYPIRKYNCLNCYYMICFLYGHHYSCLGSNKWNLWGMVFTPWKLFGNELHSDIWSSLIYHFLQCNSWTFYSISLLGFYMYHLVHSSIKRHWSHLGHRIILLSLNEQIFTCYPWSQKDIHPTLHHFHCMLFALFHC